MKKGTASLILAVVDPARFLSMKDSRIKFYRLSRSDVFVSTSW